MTTSVDLSKVKEELAPLVDAYLDEHPEVAQRYSDAVADLGQTEPAAPSPPKPSDATATDAAAESEATADIFELDEAEQDSILAEAVTDLFADQDDDDLGLADLFDEGDEETDEQTDEEPPPEVDADTLERIHEHGPDDEDIELMNEAGITTEVEFL